MECRRQGWAIPPLVDLEEEYEAADAEPYHVRTVLSVGQRRTVEIDIAIQLDDPDQRNIDCRRNRGFVQRDVG